jgi:hypothetical protein
VNFKTYFNSQLGTQAQWISDNKVVFNDIIVASDLKSKSIGIVYDISTKKKMQLECPIYHVNTEGSWAVAPNLTKIHLTQLGYGIKLNKTNDSELINEQAVKDDGIYLINLKSGSCKLLVSLYDISMAVGLPIDVPTYGFHTKWSSDGEKIMFVVRTMDPAVRIDGLLFGKRFRTQHLIVMNKNGGNIRRIISWNSNLVIHPKSIDFDGNHPNWIPGTHKISINLAKRPFENNKIYSLFERIKSFTFTHNFQKVHKWKIFSIDTDTENIEPILLYSVGSGHPSVRAGERYIISDSYSKERFFFQDQKLKYGAVPLRLIDSYTQKEIWLAQVFIQYF